VVLLVELEKVADENFLQIWHLSWRAGDSHKVPDSLSQTATLEKCNSDHSHVAETRYGSDKDACLVWKHGRMEASSFDFNQWSPENAVWMIYGRKLNQQWMEDRQGTTL